MSTSTPGDTCARLAVLVNKIRPGRQPADIPVERPMRFAWVINLTTAQAVGLTTPRALLFQVTDVIR